MKSLHRVIDEDQTAWLFFGSDWLGSFGCDLKSIVLKGSMCFVGGPDLLNR